MSDPSSSNVTAEATAPSAVPPRQLQFRLIHLLIAIGMVSVSLAIVVPCYRSAKARSEYINSARNLSQIGVALHSYHDVWHSLPPAYTCDASGKPAHSWRVLITPYMEASSSYSAYSFAEPWNGPNNSKLERETASPFRGRSPPGTTTTSYVAVVGPDTVWPGEKCIGFESVTDGLDNVIVVVEISHSDIHWMEPRDLPIEQLEAWLDPTHKPRIGGDIEGGLVLAGDGACKTLPRERAIEILRDLLVRNNRER